jgi:hypothetical protein
MTGTPRDHASAIADALDALEIRSPTDHAWMGAPAALPEVVVRLADRDGIRRALVGSIRARLYDSFFTQGAPRPAAPHADGAEPRALSDELAAANEGAGNLEPGWRVIAADGGRWVVQRSDLRLWVTAEDIAAAAGPLGVGDAVALRHRADQPALSPGFYIARGDRPFSPEGSRTIDRVYLDLRREGAAPFIREATRRLNSAGLAFTAKVVDDPGGFERRDAAVLYFERRDRAPALEAADDLAHALWPFLDHGAPAMTLPLAPGVAFAEDPGEAESFGAHRCRLIAEAAVTAAERGLQGRDDRLALVRERFEAAGTSLESAHLGPPAADAARPTDVAVRA